MKQQRNVKSRALRTMLQAAVGNGIAAGAAGLATGDYLLAGWLALGAALATITGWVQNKAENMQADRRGPVEED